LAEIKEIINSQSMPLLEAPLNSNPIGTGGAVVAIADGVALEPGGSRGETFVESGKSGTGQISIYVVREGDTLSEIAEMHGVSANTILWANDIKSASKIKIGQELVILPISGVRHTVKKGDTLQTIAKNYKADLDDVLSYNGFSTDTMIKPGDEVIIPDGVLSTTGSSYTVSSPKTSSQPSYSGYYIRPVVGGRRSQGLHGNNGIDIAAPTGTPIIAAANGVVIVSKTTGYNGGYGLYVVVRHNNGTQTLYAHMNTVFVSSGQQVGQGERLGTIGMTGRTTGPHLHFEVRGAKNPF